MVSHDVIFRFHFRFAETVMCYVPRRELFGSLGYIEELAWEGGCASRSAKGTLLAAGGKSAPYSQIGIKKGRKHSVMFKVCIDICLIHAI